MAGVSREGRAERVRYWQSLVDEHSRSGLSIAAFCKEREIAPNSLYHWRSKLLSKPKPSTSGEVALLPVKLVSTARDDRPKAASRSCIQVLTPSGVSVTVSGSATEADLVKLLRAIDTAEAARSC